jgi:hypothetical protein
MFDWALTLTTLVDMLNAADVVCPAATFTLDGTMAAAGLLLESETVTPPAGAGPVSVTVPVPVAPPVTLDGFSVTTATTGGFTVNVADWVPLSVAEMSGDAEAETALVVIVKVALDVP